MTDPRPAVTTPILPYRSIGKEEREAAVTAMSWPLSGFIGGQERGGYWVRALEEAWCKEFGVKNAVACNSATSGLLAACAAAGVEHGDPVSVPCLTMSASAAAPALLGAKLHFDDCEDESFGSSGINIAVKCAIVTNLFGHPAQVNEMSRFMSPARPIIEDNAQSPFAIERGRYAGTIGHIGCWSMNVHKHWNSGEGGVCTTDDADLALKMRHFINHGEMAGDRVGLNLRMTEVTAAIALAQLKKGKRLVQDRVEKAEAIIDAIGNIAGLRPPVVRPGCTHVYYTIPFLIDGGARRRAAFVQALAAEGVPLVEGYVAPLYRLPAFAKFARPCRVAEDLHDNRLFYFENCAWDPTLAQIRQIGTAFQKVAAYMRLANDQ
jgi:dTDP-4-amino-4,6-dideoxygalactose transaminase